MSRFDWPRDNAELVEQLARQRDRYEQLVRNMSDLLMLIAPDGTVAFCNRQGELPPGGAVFPTPGSNALDCLAERDRPVMAAAVEDVLARRVAVRDVLFRIGDAAGERIIEGTLSPVLEDGEVVQLQFLGRDVTDRHRAAEALQQAHDALQRRQADLQRELDVAGKIHASLLPAPYQTDRILIDPHHVPLLGVGGDYVYIRRDDPLRPALVVFDVSGHGVASALVANRVHSAVYAIMHVAAPLESMTRRVNRFIYDSFSDLGMFVTLFGIAFDLPAGRAYYCGAGHPPALLLRRDGADVIRLPSEHLPIGVAADIFMGEPVRDVEIVPGDRIWIYTDGLMELWAPDGTMLGIEGLARRLAGTKPADLAPGLAAHRLDAVLADHRAPEDDLTLVVAAVK